jgi:hypothetical protein
MLHHDGRGQQAQMQNDMIFLDLPAPLRAGSEASSQAEFAHLVQGLRDW